MTAVRLWICADHHTAFRCGGWAYVSLVAGQVSGAAGGERATTAHRMALAGLAAALGEPPPSGIAAGGMAAGPVAVYTSSAELAGLAALKPGEAPGEDGDLWTLIVKAMAGRKLHLVQTAAAPKTPMAFVAAWAELAHDKAKAKGRFKAIIPKPNLAKIEGLPMS
jgi:hypothetical protein